MHEVLVVGHRLTHPHEDKIIDPLSGDLLGKKDLGDYLIGTQVTLPPVESAGAELAAVGASNLGGDAEGTAVGLLSIEGR